MDEPRWVTGFRAVALVAITLLVVVFVVAIASSQASGIAKALGIAGVAAIGAGGFIRIWLASRPYGLGTWADRHERERR